MLVYFMTGAPEGLPKVVLWRSREYIVVKGGYHCV